MQQQIVFLDRESVGANVRKPEFPHSYTEYEATWTPEEILVALRAYAAKFGRPPAKQELGMAAHRLSLLAYGTPPLRLSAKPTSGRASPTGSWPARTGPRQAPSAIDSAVGRPLWTRRCAPRALDEHLRGEGQPSLRPFARGGDLPHRRARLENARAIDLRHAVVSPSRSRRICYALRPSLASDLPEETNTVAGPVRAFCRFARFTAFRRRAAPGGERAVSPSQPRSSSVSRKLPANVVRK